MTAKEFVDLWKNEKDTFLEDYCGKGNETYVRNKIASLNLSQEQQKIMNEIVDEILTDVFYTLLLGLDGSASIGGDQQPYKVYDENNNLISEYGDIEAEAYDAFISNNL